MSLPNLLKRFLPLLMVGLFISSGAWAQKSKSITGLKNYVRVSEKLHTSGSINGSDLPILLKSNVSTIISLNTESPSKVKWIKSQSNALNIKHIHIPVSWEAPTISSLEKFFEVMDSHNQSEILIHCRLNWRASAFVYLYRTIRLKEEETVARATLQKVWRPERNTTWKRFIKDAKNYFASNEQ